MRLVLTPTLNALLTGFTTETSSVAKSDLELVILAVCLELFARLDKEDSDQVALSLKLSHIDISRTYDLLTRRVSQVLPFPPASWLQVSCLRTDSVKCAFNQALPQTHASTSFILPMKMNS